MKPSEIKIGKWYKNDNDLVGTPLHPYSEDSDFWVVVELKGTGSFSNCMQGIWHQDNFGPEIEEINYFHLIVADIFTQPIIPSSVDPNSFRIQYR